MALSYIRGAKSRLKTAENAYNDGDFAYTVRQSQECVELSLKAILRLVGIEPPKWHDVGIILKENSNRFPHDFQKDIGRLAFVSRRLRREREASMYGDEELGLSPHELYDEYDAKVSLDDAKFVYKRCEELIDRSLDR